MVRSIDPAAFERTIEVNLLGVWRTVRACLPHVIERRGYVLVIASLAAAFHAPGMAAYAASKAGAEAFADSLRVEVTHLGVDVGVGYFAFIDTDMVRGARRPSGARAACARSGRAARQDLPAVGRRARRSWRASRSVAAGWWCPAGCAPMLVLRTALAPLIDRAAVERAAETDARFQQDVAERGAEAASAPVGAGRRAAREREPAEPR